MLEADYLVIGSGLAGLYFALRASEHGRVLIATKRAASESNTSYAQGGVAGVLDPDDRIETHIEDTLRVGDGLCNREVVESCLREGPEHILRFANELGVPFDRGPDGQFELGREGGHTARRIVHAKDSTGAAIHRTLLQRVMERDDRIQLLPDHLAIDLLTTAKYGGPNAVFGAYLYDQTTGEVKTATARAVVLATGGAGKVYLYTTNPDVATGDGIAMAYRVGARVANMEFFQFHPTCLYHPQAKSFLISEALRGEGGILRLRDGTAFMHRYHEMKDLAPRDVVARAIDAELKRTGDDHVVLDMTHLPGDFLVERFPNIHQRCLELGIDMRRMPIPVVPAAHYCCGGVAVDERGRTERAQPVRHRRDVDDRIAWRLPAGVQLAARGDGVRGARRRRREERRLGSARPRRALVRGRGDVARRGRRGQPQLGRDPPPHVELRRHRAHRPAARARRAAHRAHPRRRSATTTGTCA